eukprot:gene9244-biopygen22699
MKLCPRAWAPIPPTGRQEGTGLCPETVVGKLGQSPIPSPPRARAARRVGADARREAWIYAPGCAPENHENADPPPRAPRHPSTDPRIPSKVHRRRVHTHARRRRRARAGGA